MHGDGTLSPRKHSSDAVLKAHSMASRSASSSGESMYLKIDETGDMDLMLSKSSLGTENVSTVATVP